MSKSGKAYLDEVYKHPLPLHNVVPLPEFSYDFRRITKYLYAYLFPRVPRQERLSGTLDKETCSVWVHDQEHAAKLWTEGFFGKGQFSRSEPSWYVRTQRALGLIGKHERLTPEEITARRRVARAEMKADRARKEKDELEAILRAEGKLPFLEVLGGESEARLIADEDRLLIDTDLPTIDAIPNLENMQLTLFEALFLSLSLDTLDIYLPQSADPLDRTTLLALFTDLYGTQHESDDTSLVQTSAKFLVHYAVYHHYRSLGWTVKPGVKFGVDWLLYKRGPVFSHAEFSIVVIPSPLPNDTEDRSWWWLHMLSRVNGQVKKTIILTYVNFEEQMIALDDMTLQDVLALYKVREVSVRRWIPSRNRD